MHTDHHSIFLPALNRFHPRASLPWPWRWCLLIWIGLSAAGWALIIRLISWALS